MAPHPASQGMPVDSEDGRYPVGVNPLANNNGWMVSPLTA
jgi:hypothetical protein